jgi:uridylate kinase
LHAGFAAPVDDAVAALLAERVKADLIVNWTSVDGIYSADPTTVVDKNHAMTSNDNVWP